MSTSTATATPYSSESPPSHGAQYGFIALGIICIVALGNIILVIACLCIRRWARLARDGELRREATLVTQGNSRHAETVRACLLSGSVAAQRNSLELILAATPRNPAPTPASAPERFSKLKTNDAAERAEQVMRDAGEVSKERGDDEWGTLPPYSFAIGE
jgi:hypothetical protein